MPPNRAALQRRIEELEAALLEKQIQQLPLLFDNLSDAVFFLDRQRIIQYVNHAGTKLFGYPAEELIHQTSIKLYADVTDFHDRQVVYNQLDVDQELPLEEVYFKNKAGRVFPVEVIRSPVHDSTGQAIGLLVLLRDISERRLTEEALRVSQNFIGRLNEASPHATYVYNMTKRINTYLSPRIEQLFGYSVQELYAMGTDLYPRLLHPHDITIFPEWLAKLRAAKDGEVVTFEQRYKHKNGQWRWYYMRQVVFSRDATGKPLELTGTMEDVTDRKEAELALQLASNELIVSRNSLQRLITQLPIGIQIFDTSGLCTDVNQTHLDIFSITDRTQLVGRYNIFNDPLAVMTGTQQAAQRALTGETVYLGDIHFNFDQFVTPWAGRQKMRVVNVTIFPLLDQDGSVINIVGLNQDVTERYQSEQQSLKIALQGERIKLLESLIRDISHDLRTPLTIIGTCLYLIRKTSTPDQQKYVDRIELQMSRLVKLIDGLITISRLDQADTLPMKPLNLAILLRTLALSLQHQAQEREVNLVLNLDDQELYLDGNEDELDYAIRSVVENGLIFTPSGGQVTVKGWKDHYFVYIEVTDTGIGIEEADLSHIFERFFRADKARATDTGGAGLGLAIAQRIISLHQGRIEVNSQANEGSRFIIQLPYS